jgi:hypothetical protein
MIPHEKVRTLSTPSSPDWASDNGDGGGDTSAREARQAYPHGFAAEVCAVVESGVNNK